MNESWLKEKILETIRQHLTIDISTGVDYYGCYTVCVRLFLESDGGKELISEHEDWIHTGND